MPRETLKYTSDKVTVVWKPKLCIHSAICFKGLPEVFNPKVRPWVNINGADAAQIIAQVGRCPSGALSIEHSDEPTPLNTDAGNEKAPPHTEIQIQKNGPALVKATCVIKGADGKEETRKGVVALCRCGASGSKPYCDGSHSRIRFEG